MCCSYRIRIRPYGSGSDHNTRTQSIKPVGRTILSRSLSPCHTVSYYISWVKTSWTDSTLFVHYCNTNYKQSFDKFSFVVNNMVLYNNMVLNMGALRTVEVK